MLAQHGEISTSGCMLVLTHQGRAEPTTVHSPLMHSRRVSPLTLDMMTSFQQQPTLPRKV